MLSRYNKSKAVTRDIPQGDRLSVKGREVRVVSTFQQPTRGTGKRWGNGIAPTKPAASVWRYVCPVTGKVSYASTKPKDKDRAKGWHKWR